jgi:hypothetical protein
LNFSLDIARQFVFRNFEVVSSLEIQPKTCAGIEVPCEPKGGIRRDSAALVHDLRNARYRDMKIEREPVHAELKRFHELGAQNLARMDGWKAFLRLRHECPLVIIDDLYVVGVPFAPNKAQTPLVVDPNAVLSLSVAMQGFQAISRRRCQVSQFRGGIHLPKLPARDTLDCLKAPARLPRVKSPGFRGAERLNHNLEYITCSV